MKKYISLIIVFSFLFISCSDDFLNDPKPTASVSEEEVYSNAESAQSQITGILRMFRGEFQTVDAAGVYSTYMARTVKGNDIILGFMWYLFDYAHDNREPNYYRTSFAWEYPYYMISQCNNLIKGVNNSEGITEAQKKRLLAQGKAIRAFFYFQLAMEFQHTYTKNPNLPAPPIYTEPTIEPKGMSTLQEMYDLIVSDLTYATANLDDSRLSKSYINQKVANGILARVYQVIENWEGAEAAAIAAYGGQPESVLFADTYNDGFDKIENEEWLWGLEQRTDQSAYYNMAPHAFADNISLAYGQMFINENFIDEFTDTDKRKLFQKNPSEDPGENTAYDDWITTKFKFSFECHSPIMRYPEMILIEAEAKYHQGFEQQAHNLLYTLQKDRDPEAVKSSNSGADLFEEILLERRKELYAELGVEWFDAKRLRRGITRDPNHRQAFNIPRDSRLFFLKVPQGEIDANPLIDESVNDGR